METRSLTNENAHFFNVIKNWLQTPQGKIISCPVCRDATNWKWSDIITIPFQPHGLNLCRLVALTCTCGTTAFVQQTAENGLKLP
jgi:hypothetical protein